MDSVNRQKLSVLWYCLLCFAYVIYWKFNIPTLFYIATIALLVTTVLENTWSNLKMMVFVLPGISMLKQGEESFALFSLLTIILVVKIILTKKMLSKTSITMALILLSTEMVTYAINGLGLHYIGSDIRVIIDVILLLNFKMTVENFNEKHLRELLQMFRGGVMCMCILSLLSSMMDFVTEKWRFSFINADPNYTGLCIALATIVCIQLNREKQNKFSDIIRIIFMIVLGFSTQSRGYVVAMGVAFLLIVINRVHIGKLEVRKALITAMTILLGAVLLMKSGLLSLVINRFTDESTSGGSGRLLIWSEYLQMWLKNIPTMFMGIGYSNNAYFMGQARVQHNLFLEILTGRGIVGTIIWAFLSVKLYQKTACKNRESSITLECLLPIAILTCSYLFLNGLASDFCIFTWWIAFLSSNLSRLEYQRKVDNT